MFALDAATGRAIVALDNIGAAPLTVKDKVIVGGNNGDGAHRGYLTAFYVKTGPCVFGDRERGQ
jgi:hypothetical protein